MLNLTWSSFYSVFSLVHTWY